MTTKFSFSKNEQEILPVFRQKMNNAESTEDVRKFFVRTVIGLFGSVFSDSLEVEYEDVFLRPDAAPFFGLSTRLAGDARFQAVWNGSDLPSVVGRLAKSARCRFRHMEKNPEKTESKIRR